MKTGEIYPTNTAPILMGPFLPPESAAWGFPGFKGNGVVIDARAETASEKRMFAESLVARRCVIPSTGFYEWKKEGTEIQADQAASADADARGILHSLPFVCMILCMRWNPQMQRREALLKAFLTKYRNTLLVVVFLSISIPAIFIMDVAKTYCTEPIEAVVIKERKRQVSSNQKRTSSYYVYDATVAFEMRGVQYEGKVTNPGGPLGVGNPVLVYYNPSHPSSIILPYEKGRVEEQYLSAGGMIYSVLFSIPVAAAFIAIGVFTDRQREKRRDTAP